MRYYTITCSNNANVSSATVTINYTNDGVTDAPNLRIAKSNGSSWLNIGGTGSAAGTGSITSSAFTSFSDFVLANSTGGLNPLPLQWVSFTATKNNKSVVLSWETAAEMNTSRFNIQRSSNGSNWTVIHTLPTNNGAFNNYTYTDANPLAGISYYRIQSIDQDGATSYSTVAIVNFNDYKNTLTISPNPVYGAFFTCFVNDATLLQQSAIQVTIIDLKGTVVASYNKAPAAVMYFNQPLSKGSYVVRMRSGKYVVESLLVRM